MCPQSLRMPALDDPGSRRWRDPGYGTVADRRVPLGVLRADDKRRDGLSSLIFEHYF